MFFFNFEEDKLKNYYLAYFDILGYKSYFENEKDPYEFLTVIEDALNDVKKGVSITQTLNKVKIGFRVYSDNFLFYITQDYDELSAIASFAYLLSLIQRRLLEKYSLFIRGGISKGKFFYNEELLFGKGLIDVYTLESKFAIYPRIIIDNSENLFSKETLSTLYNTNYIEKDDDGYFYIQYLSAFGENDDYITLKNNIKKLVNCNCRYRTMVDPNKIKEKEKLIAKYLWLVTRYNNYFDKVQLVDKKIDFITTVHSKLLKVEVACK